MAQSTNNSPLESIYESRIGEVTNTHEVIGYWGFLAGVIVGFLGIVLYAITEPATMSRAVGYALAALSPAMLMAGAVLRFPLRKMATTLVAAGFSLTVASVGWFLWVFPYGWSLTTGNTAVIVSYIGGLAIIGIAGSVIPLATDPRDAAVEAAEQRARTANERADSAEDNTRNEQANSAGLRDDLANSEDDLEDSEDHVTALLGEIDGLEGDDEDITSSKAEFELYEDDAAQWRWRLVHDNGNIIADCGEGYTTKVNAKKGLGSVQLNSPGAETKEL